MKPILKVAFLAVAVAILASCGTTSRKPAYRPTIAHKVQSVRIGNTDHMEGSQEPVLYSMGLIDTPYRWRGNKAEMGFDCSDITQSAYKNAFGVSLPRTVHDMAAASRKTPDSKLRAGDLVFFGTGGTHKHSHVSLYIDNDEFIHAPSSDETVQTEKLSKPFYAKNYLGVHTFFTD